MRCPWSFLFFAATTAQVLGERPLALTRVASAPNDRNWRSEWRSSGRGALDKAGYYAIVGLDGRPLREMTNNPMTSVMLNCSVLSGDPATHIIWKRRQRVLAESRGSLMWLNYTIHSVLQKDSGLYKCIVIRNNYKLSGISYVSLHVNARPIITYRTSSPQFKYMGDTGTFHCYATARPQATFQWKFNALPLKDGDLGDSVLLIRKEKGLELWISSFGKQHEGIFTCEASNILGNASVEVQSIVAYRPLEVPPKVIAVTSTRHYFSHSQAEMECKADNVPLWYYDCPVLWKFKGSVLKNSKKYNVTNKCDLKVVGRYYAKYKVHSNLEIRHLVPSDGGVYTCQVPTYTGRDEVQVALNVTNVSHIPISSKRT